MKTLSPFIIVVALLVSSATHAHHTEYSPQGGWLSQVEPRNPANQCEMQANHYREFYADAEDYDLENFPGFKRCGVYGFGGVSTLLNLQYADWDHNLKAACEFQTQYQQCGYATFDCDVLNAARGLLSDLLERDWCSEYAEQLERRERVVKALPTILNHLLSE